MFSYVREQFQTAELYIGQEKVETLRRNKAQEKEAYLLSFVRIYVDLDFPILFVYLCLAELTS